MSYSWIRARGVSASLALMALSALACGDAAKSAATTNDNENLPSLGSSASNVADGRYVLKAQHSQKCLDIRDGSADNRAAVQQLTCNGTSAQSFDVRHIDNIYVQILNVGSGKSLDVTDRSLANGAPLQQWSYVGGANQQFSLEPQADGSYAVRARESGHVLDVTDRSEADGAAVQQWTWFGSANQKWVLESVGAPSAPPAPPVSPPPGGGTPPVGYVHVAGHDFIDGAGNRLLLRTMALGNWLLPEGYMWGFDGARGDRPRRIEARIQELVGATKAQAFWRAYRDNFITEADIARIAELGFNSVRVAMNARLLLPEGQDVFDEAEFQYVTNLVEWCRIHGIYAILDMHAAPGGETGKNIDDSPNDFPELYTVASNQDRLVRIWTELARRYAKLPSVLGYDLLNEPLPGDFSWLNDRLWPLYERVGQAIRAVDKNHTLIVEGANWANDWNALRAPFDENMAYSFHKYWNATDQASIQWYIDLRNQWNRPVWVGEIGENNNDWYRAAFPLLERNGMGWAFWPWKKINGGNNPYGVAAPSNWWQIQNFVKDASQKPSPGDAQRALDELLVNIRLSNAHYNASVVCTLVPCK